MALQIAQSNKEIRRLFETYTRKNLNSTDIKSRLYSGEISEEIFTENRVMNVNEFLNQVPMNI